MEKIKLITVFGSEYIMVNYEDGSGYYSDESIGDVQKMLVTNNIDFDNYYLSVNCGTKLTMDEMKEKFGEDFKYDDDYLDEDDVYNYTLELINPVELYIEESETINLC